MRALAQKLGVEVPLCEAVAKVLDGELCVDGAIAAVGPDVADDETGELESVAILGQFGEIPDDFAESLQGG